MAAPLVFGATTSAALAAAMSALQERLHPTDRQLAFTVFHVLTRGGLAAAALGAGAAADLIDGVRWPYVQDVSPVRLVLFASGVVVLVTAAAIRPPQPGPARRIPSGPGPGP